MPEAFPEFSVYLSPVCLGPRSWEWAADLLNILTLVFLMVCAYTDLALHKIFNKVTFPAAAAGLILNTICSGLPGAVSSLLGLAVGFGVFFVIFMFTGSIGGGDVKLMGAIGALQGYPFIIHAMGWSFAANFIGALFVMTMSGALARSLWNVFHVTGTFVLSLVRPGYEPARLSPENSQKMPYGIGIALGTMVAWLSVGCGFLKL